MTKQRTRRQIVTQQVLLGLSLVFLAFGLFNLAWAVWPAPMETVHFTIPVGTLAGAPTGTTYASLAEYILDVSYSSRLRAGESGSITVTLTEGDSDGGQVIDRQTQLVLVEPVIIGLQVEPPGRIQINLAEEQDLTLTWTITGTVTGDHPGKLYVSFGFYDDALAEVVPVPVAVVDMVFRVTALWGLDARFAVWFGVIGLVLWGLLFGLGNAQKRTN